MMHSKRHFIIRQVMLIQGKFSRMRNKLVWWPTKNTLTKTFRTFKKHCIYRRDNTVDVINSTDWAIGKSVFTPIAHQGFKDAQFLLAKPAPYWFLYIITGFRIHKLSAPEQGQAHHSLFLPDELQRQETDPLRHGPVLFS